MAKVDSARERRELQPSRRSKGRRNLRQPGGHVHKTSLSVHEFRPLYRLPRRGIGKSNSDGGEMASRRTAVAKPGASDSDQENSIELGDRCPHFQTRVEKLSLEMTTAYLPIRRCLLSERMLTLLRPIEEAREIVETIAMEPDTEDAYFCVCGPDLDTIEHRKCSAARCESSCTVAFEEILGAFNLKDDPPVGCDSPARAPASSSHAGA